MSKPRVITRCIANVNTGPNERIIEFSFPGTKGDMYLQGGLISFRVVDGVGYVEIYNCDRDLVVNGYRVGDGDTGDRNPDERSKP